MRYMLLIYSDETGGTGWSALTPAQQAEAMGAYIAYTEALRNSGKLVASHQLQPGSTAKTVTVSAGRRNVVDGPYAETKEELGGFYLIEAETQAEALDWAAKCPGASHGKMEVRPVVMR